MKAPAKSSAKFYVIGLSFDLPLRKDIARAFPQAIFYTATSGNRGITPWLCDQLGRFVIFCNMLRLLPHMEIPTSAHFSEIAVKMVGIHPHPTIETYRRAFDLEYVGVLPTESDAETLCRVAKAVLDGELWFPRHYLSSRIQTLAQASGRRWLSEREEELLALLAEDATNQQIAELLFVTRDTVRWHLRSIYAKLGVSNRAAALRLAHNRFPPGGTASSDSGSAATSGG